MRSLRRFPRFVPADDRPPGLWPPSAVNLLVAAWCGLFVASSIMGRRNPLEDWGSLTGRTLAHGEVWRLLTYWLLHDSYGAWLVPNALVLLFAGRNLEAIIGRRHLAGVLGLGAIFAGALRAGGSLLMDLETPEAQMAGVGKHIVGAGGPAMAALFAFALIMPDLELGALIYVPARIMRVKVKTLAAALLFVPVGLFALFSLPPLLQPYDPTATHRLACAGAVVGALVGWLYARALGYGRRWPTACNRRMAAVLPSAAEVPPSSPMSDDPPSPATATHPWPSAPPPPATVQAPGNNNNNAAATAGAPVSVAEPPPADTGNEDTEALPALTEVERRMSARQYIAEVADPVLEKLFREGIASLTASERRVLRKARAKMLLDGGGSGNGSVNAARQRG